MPKKGRKNGQQVRLPFTPDHAPHEVLASIKRRLTAIIKKSDSREALAEFLTNISDRKVTVAMINNWTCESKPQHVPPIHLVPFICLYCRNNKPVETLVKVLGMTMISEPEKIFLEIGKVAQRQRELDIRATQLLGKRR